MLQHFETTWRALHTSDAALICRAYLHALDATLEMPFHERNEQGAMVYNPLGMDDMEGTFEEIDLDIVDSDDELEVDPLHLNNVTCAELSASCDVLFCDMGFSGMPSRQELQHCLLASK